jgi:hypothetical protein
MKLAPVLAGAFGAVLANAGSSPAPEGQEPVRVTPGTFGRWAEQGS